MDSSSTLEEVKSASHSIGNLDEKFTRFDGQITQLGSMMSSWIAESQRVREEYVSKKDLREIMDMTSYYIMMAETQRVSSHQGACPIPYS